MIILQQTRGLLSSNDELALDLPLAETKSITARVGPTPVFTRSSTGTYFGPLVEFGAFVFYTTTIQSGRAFWEYVSIEGDQYSFEYSGFGWQLRVFLAVAEEPYYANAAEGSEWRPEQADWSGSGLTSTPTASSTSGIVRAATNEPRFEHDPLTGVCGGLLLEQSRTNICLQSENFGTTWTNDGGAVTITTNVEVSPDGSTTADKIAESTSTTNRRISIQNISVTSGTTYSYSCYIKAGERDFAQMATGTGLNSAFQNFIVNGANAGTLGSSSGIVSSRIDAMPNGWYRCTIVVTATTTGTTNVTVGPAPSSTITRWQSYSSTAGSGIYAWGAQLEAGATATSYIPTTTGSLARSQDLYTITGANFSSMYNQSQSTVFYAARAVGATTAQSGVFGIHGPVRSDGGVTSSFSGTVLSVSSYGPSNATQASFNAQKSRNTLVKAAIAVRTNDYAGSIDGSIATDTSGTLEIGMDRFVIGANGNLSGPQIGNNIFSSVRYYRKRLPNPKLQALTQ
jgi:hypothetical protein